jgi:hypothetical protein
LAKTIQQFEQLSLDESAFKDSFWGRSPMTSWYLYIEQFEMNNNNIDLSALSEIQIAIQYDSFLL